MLSEEDIAAINDLLDRQRLGRSDRANKVGDMEEIPGTGDRLCEEMNPASKSRPHRDGMPLPWSAGLGPVFKSWGHINSERAARAEKERLCIMCGTDLGDQYVYANFKGKPHDRRAQDAFEKIYLDVPPIATFVHPRCLLLASSFCPFLTAMTHPGLDQAGNPLSRDDLRKMTNVHKVKV